MSNTSFLIAHLARRVKEARALTTAETWLNGHTVAGVKHCAHYPPDSE